MGIFSRSCIPGISCFCMLNEKTLRYLWSTVAELMLCKTGRWLSSNWSSVNSLKLFYDAWKVDTGLVSFPDAFSRCLPLFSTTVLRGCEISALIYLFLPGLSELQLETKPMGSQYHTLNNLFLTFELEVLNCLPLYRSIGEK